MTKILKSAVIFFALFFSSLLMAVSFPASPTPFQYVNDYTRTLTGNEKQQLENKLIAYSKETSSQIAVVLIPSTEEYDISQYAFELGDKWGIGRKQLNNGVLMLVAVNDRKIFIATGQGLEGALPDAFLSQIIRQVITPQFKQNHYAQGISHGLDYIIAASKGEFDPYQQEENDWGSYIPFVMVCLFVFFVIFGELSWRKKPYISPSNRHQMENLIRQSSLSRRGRSGFGGFGGGFGDGAGGSGFGGGGFGGGGAGGSW
ncbi:TPM domain-containing protein [Actinobacillus seminis]|uniref:TPM domain-containing protein n=1 Tax=Actinobacillus seminis TaxID=722 RepID=UPI003B957D6D